MIILAEIVIPPSDVYGFKYPPLGLACLASALYKAGFDARIELFRPEDEPMRWGRRVLDLAPQLVGFSVFIGYKLEKALQLSRLLKQLKPDLPILWGGVHPTMTPEQTLAEPSIDWSGLGPGEHTIVALAQAIRDNTPVASIPSLAWRANGQIFINPGDNQPHIVQMHRPAWESFPVEEFIFEAEGGDKAIGFITSRGCPHNCGFCYNRAFHGQCWYPADLELVQQEMISLNSQYAVNAFLFLDDCFFGNRKRAIRLLEWMANNDFTCQGVDVRLDELGSDLLDRLKSANTRTVFIGMESASDRVLKMINKGITASKQSHAFNLLQNYPVLTVWLSCIVGLPTETFEEMQETISTAARMAQSRPNTLVNVNAFIPFPGTDLYELAIANHYQYPKSLEQWSELGKQDRCAGLAHFPGRLSDDQSRYLERAGIYLRMLFRPYPPHKKSILHRTITQLFFLLSSLRFRFQMMRIPAEIWLYNLLRQVVRSLRKN